MLRGSAINVIMIEGAQSAHKRSKEETMAYELPVTVLGRTGLTVTRLGIGGAYCKTPDGYRAALDCGVNYLDTARAYRDGDDERVVGEAIAGRRHEVILSTKSVKRDAAARFSFLLSTPVIVGAGVWQLKDLFASGAEAALGPMLIGLVSSAAIGYACIRFLLGYLRRKGLYPFAVYCALAGTTCFVISFFR